MVSQPRTDFLLDAPEILSGWVIESKEAGWLRPNTGRRPEQQWCAKVRVEHVLRGAAISGDIDVYFFLERGMGRGSMSDIYFESGDS